MSMAAPRQTTQYGYLGLAQQQQQAAQQRIRAARQQLRDAKTDDERKSARAQLRQLLAEIFSQDMQTREKQAAEIESRLSKLRQQYREREKVKDEIIDLQLKVIEQDAAGLGFPSTGPTTGPPPTGTGQTRIPESSEQSQIARERVETLRQQFKVLEREYQIGKVTIDRVLRASNDLLEAELEVAESSAKRIKILEQQAANLEMLEAVTTQVYKAGKVGVEDVLAAEADRLAAQTRLDRERSSSAASAARPDVGQFQGILEYDGRRTITVFAPVDSRAERVYVDHVGTDVKKGDALVQLQSAELDTAEKEFLVARKSGQQSVLAAAQNRLRHLGLAQEQIDALDQEDEATGRLTLYSPTNGIVTSSHVVEGAGVKVNDQLFTIADPTVLWVQLEAPESALSWFHFDQPVTLTVDAYPETTYAGTIAFIEPRVDPKTRTVKLRVDLANSDRKLKPGMTVRAFVNSSAATPPTPIRSGNPFGNRSNLPASDTPSDPLFRSGLPSPNVPALRADQHDPIPEERTLEEAKKTRPAEVAELTKRGHFIESTDGKIYAYANTNQPSRASHIRVVDSATGKLIGAAAVNSVVGPLEFTEDGVASRETDGVLQLRVPLKRRTGPEGAVFEIPASTAQAPFDPKQAALDPEFLKQYSTDPQARVGELSARGHFVVSQDRKWYAYVETKGDGIPEGTAEIRVCDVRTGQRLAAAKIKAPVGKLKFFNEGVATEDPDGTLKLRITFSTKHDTQDVLETVFPKTSNTNQSPSSGTVVSPASSDATVTSEYNALQNQYRKAKVPLEQAEARFNLLVAEAQKLRPETSIGDVKKQHPAAWQAVERARPDYEAANRLLETKLDLLKLDRKAATVARDAARSKLAELTERHKQNAISTSDVIQQRAALEAADFETERASRLITLFESITFEPIANSDSQSANKLSGPEDITADPVTLSDTPVAPGTRVPALASAQGVSVRDILAFKPEAAGIDYDQPTDSEIDACRVVLEPGEAWTLLDRDLVLLRRFVDKNHDGVVDLWAYYKAGEEVHRDVDTDYDGKIDYAEGVDDGKGDDVPNASDAPMD
ncbi:MAG: efflux RND transporter periplasmic adaptor subunit [Planctomycetia bacterium]|nr:efflux RND transporter periplasmic adaptor subunit [Planctomycetia bacterium]